MRRRRTPVPATNKEITMTVNSNDAPLERDRHSDALGEGFNWHRIRRLSRKD